MKTMKWLLRREFWEHKGAFFWTPVAVAAAMLLLVGGGFMYAMAFGGSEAIQINGHNVVSIQGIPPALRYKIAHVAASGYLGLAAPLFIVLAVVVFFYCLAALHDDRRDRSILFWKSLPATDTMTVLSKLVTAVLVAPFLAMAATMLLHVGFLVLVSLYAALHGVNPLPFLWQPALLGKVWLQMLAMVPVHMLWAIPGIAWLLLASSWSKRAPFVWALLIPCLAGVLYGFVEAAVRLSTPSSWFWEHIVGRIFSSPGSMLLRPWNWREGPGTQNPFAQSVSWERMQAVLSAPETWIGLAIGVVLLAAAIWLRRFRDDS